VIVVITLEPTKTHKTSADYGGESLDTAEYDLIVSRDTRAILRSPSTFLFGCPDLPLERPRCGDPADC